MWIYVWDSEIKGIYLWDTPVKEVYLWDTKIRPTKLPWLCFIAEQANSTVKLNKSWSPTSVSIETSIDWSSWTDYSFWTTITLSSIGDKVYFRNKSETATWFSTYFSTDYYSFSITWAIGCSGDVGYLLCKNSTDTITSDHCFARLFYQCTWLTKSPSFPATTLKTRCYHQTFRGCTSLKQIPALPALSLTNYCYSQMFYGCSLIKLSTTQNADYTQPYRIPTSWTWTVATSSLKSMFSQTWWTFTSNPSINTTYYVHKDNVIV